MTDPANPPTTRETIWSAAHGLFARNGFARTTVRDIAREAGVDPALVVRHFGSKEQLFVDTMRLEIEPRVFVDAPLDELGEQMIRYLLDGSEQVRGVYLALMRASDNAGIGSQLRRANEVLFVAPLRARLQGEDAELRARLAAALVGGLLYSLWLVGDDELAADQPELIRRYGRLLQSLFTP